MKEVLVEFDVNDQIEIDRLLGLISAHIRSWDYEEKGIPTLDLREWACVQFPTFRVRFISVRERQSREDFEEKLKSWCGSEERRL